MKRNLYVSRVEIPSASRRRVEILAGEHPVLRLWQHTAYHDDWWPLRASEIHTELDTPQHSNPRFVPTSVCTSSVIIYGMGWR